MLYNFLLFLDINYKINTLKMASNSRNNSAPVPKVMVVGIPAMLKAFGEINKYMKWILLKEVTMDVKWEIEKIDLGRYAEKLRGRSDNWPVDMVAVIFLSHLPIRPQSARVQKSAEVIQKVIRETLRFTDRVAVMLNIPSDETTENKGFEELNEILTRTPFLPTENSERCVFFQPALEDEAVRPFQHLRGSAGHMREGVQRHYSRICLTGDSFKEFLERSLPMRKREPPVQKTIADRLGKRKGSGSSSERQPKVSKPTLKGEYDYRRAARFTPPLDHGGNPSGMEVELRVKQVLLFDLREELREARLEIKKITLQVGELQGERRILRRLLRRKTVAGRRLVSSSSSASSSSSDSESEEDKRAPVVSQRERESSSKRQSPERVVENVGSPPKPMTCDDLLESAVFPKESVSNRRTW